MNNSDFLSIIKQSFIKFLETNSRSNKKLEILHGAIANNLADLLGEQYIIKSLGYKEGNEFKIAGRYIDKNVDITVLNNQGKVLAGIGVKFVMQNYAQNSNNYFENMLGETANIQSNNIPYFQILIIPEKIPYYKENNIINKWESLSHHQIKKYIELSRDNANIFRHSPTKTLLYLVRFTNENENLSNKEEYKSHYLNSLFNVEESKKFNSNIFHQGVILNDYETFIDKVKHRILSI